MIYCAKKHFCFFCLFFCLMLWHSLQVLHPSFEMYEFFSVYSCPLLQCVLALLLAILVSMAFLGKVKWLTNLSLESINSIGNPLLILLIIVSDFCPIFLASTQGIMDMPSIMYLWTLSIFLCCSSLVDHLQFSGKYPLSLSIRSNECDGLGFSHISSRKFLNLSSHREHTLIPRPPYRWYALLLGLLHRLFMSLQVVYKGCLCKLSKLRFISPPNKERGYNNLYCYVIQGVSCYA